VRSRWLDVSYEGGTAPGIWEVEELGNKYPGVLGSQRAAERRRGCVKDRKSRSRGPESPSLT
jgi:hypothetical protein